MFKECYAMEKIHGTSAHISYKDNKILFFSGGEKQETFENIFDKKELLKKIKKLGTEDIKIYGEAYGGKCQGMSETYGKDLRFIVFDIKINDLWLNVYKADDLTTSLGLEFVAYHKIFTYLNSIDSEKDFLQ